MRNLEQAVCWDRAAWNSSWPLAVTGKRTEQVRTSGSRTGQIKVYRRSVRVIPACHSYFNELLHSYTYINIIVQKGKEMVCAEHLLCTRQ